MAVGAICTFRRTCIKVEANFVFGTENVVGLPSVALPLCEKFALDPSWLSNSQVNVAGVVASCGRCVVLLDVRSAALNKTFAALPESGMGSLTLTVNGLTVYA